MPLLTNVSRRLAARVCTVVITDPPPFAWQGALLLALVLTLGALPGGTQAQEAQDPRGSRAGSFATAGATVGALGLGGLFGLVAAGLCDQAVCDGEFTHGFMVGAPLGAAVGALLGVAIGVHAPDDRSDRAVAGPDSAPAAGLTWRFAYGRPMASRAVPEPVRSVRLGVGWRLRPRTSIEGHAGRLDFAEHQRVYETSVPLSTFADEDAQTTSLLVGIAQEIDREGHLNVRAAAGVARTKGWSVVTEQWPERRAQRFDSEEAGLHLAAGVEGSWVLGQRGLHMGFAASVDWISDSPMGSIPFTSLALAIGR